MKTLSPSQTIIASILLVGPLLLYIALKLVPSINVVWEYHIFHFYIVSLTSLVALVVAVFVLSSPALEGSRAIFAATGFAAMAAVFMLHAVATPGVMAADGSHGIGLSARLSLLLGAVFLSLASRSAPTVWEQRIVAHPRRLWFGLIILYITYIMLITMMPDLVVRIEAQTGLAVITAVISIALLLLGSWRAWQHYFQEPRRLTLALAFAMPWLAVAQVSQILGPSWTLAWWMYHVLMLSAFVVTMVALVTDYERVLTFQVTRYFTALSVIAGVPVVAIVSEATVRLSGNEATRWPMFLFSLLAVLLLFMTLLIVVRRAEAILTIRAKDLEAQKQWRTDFTNLIVHDLKSPLSVTSVSLELIKSGRVAKLPAALETLIDRAQRGNKETLELVENLLDIEKLEAKALDIVPSTLEVKTFVGDCTESVRGLAEACDLNLDYAVAPELTTLQGDGALLRRVLQNLLTNAIKYTPEGGAIHVEANAVQNNALQIAITDTGFGIPADQREHIFDKFVQIAGMQRHGVGLGLTFCKLAVEAHGGRIWVEDAPTRGSRFVFTLPLTP